MRFINYSNKTICCLILGLGLSFAIMLSCKKEPSCKNGCAFNQPPKADAGVDQKLILPTDSVLLDGSSSSDPDGKIVSYKWAKVSGPNSFIIIVSDSSRRRVRSLVMGVYQFELTVIDNGKLSGKDTVQVTVSDPTPTNRPPVGNAGIDHIIILPDNIDTLDGTGSTDPDNNITAYAWTKISGPSTFTIANPNTVKTEATNLVQGVYQFELKVTDALGLFSKDTVLLTVTNAATSSCDITKRPLINARLIPIGALSQDRDYFSMASAGNKVLIAGGHLGPGKEGFSRVDILNIATNTWSTAELSQPRTGITTAILGNRIFFAGGLDKTKPSSRVDIYDVVSNTWSTAELSVARYSMSGVAAGNKVFFAGGIDGFFHYSNTVDIYDALSGTWSTSSLSGRTSTGTIGIAAVAIGNKVYFAGEASDWVAWDFGSISPTINIYDLSTKTWSTSNLSIGRGFMASISVDNKIYWAGGLYKQPFEPFTSLVEIRDENIGSSTFGCLFQPNAFFSAVLTNNKIVYFTSGVNVPSYWPSSALAMNKFDIYDIAKGEWSIGVLPVNIYGSHPQHKSRCLQKQQTIQVITK